MLHRAILLCFVWVFSSSYLFARPLIIGHRGARMVRPENTLSGFLYASRVGAKWIELDVLMTKNRHLVVHHDDRLNTVLCRSEMTKRLKSDKLKNNRPPIFSLSLKEFKALDCGSFRNSRFPKQKRKKEAPPTLEEVFGALKNTDLNILVEVKHPPAAPELGPDAKTIAKAVVNLIRKHHFEKRAVIISFDHDVIRVAKRFAPNIRRGLLFSDSHPNYLLLAKELKVSFVLPHRDWITKSDITSLHQAGVSIFPWTANSKADWGRLIRIGVDGIITDDPKGLRVFLDRSDKSAIDWCDTQ